jgi:hypothetical protein
MKINIAAPSKYKRPLFDKHLNLLKHKKEDIYVITYGKVIVQILETSELKEYFTGVCLVDNSENTINKKGTLLECNLEDYEKFEGDILISNN